MCAPSCAGSHYGDTTRSLHLDLYGIDDQQYTEGNVADSGADAAAGGCSRAPPRKDQRPPATELQLHLLPEEDAKRQNRAVGGIVASSAAVQLDIDLSNAEAVHSRAMLAIDRISRQQSALRRFPMVCPSCGTLNAPPGLAWGAGDIAACQGCSQSFVPLGHGLQEGDVGLLRTAIDELRSQKERAARLEQTLSRVQPSPSSLSLQHRMQPSYSSGTPACASPTGNTLKSGFFSVPPSELSQGMLASSTLQACRPLSPAKPKSSQPQLVSLFDTQDLMTNSSSGSGPCFYGRKLRHRQPTIDTRQQPAANLNYKSRESREIHQKKCREDGEISSSAAASDSEISSSGRSARARLTKSRLSNSLTRTPEPPARSSRAMSMAPTLEYSSAPQPKAGLAPAAATKFDIGIGIAEVCVIGKQFLLFLVVCLVQCIITSIVGEQNSALVSAIVSGALASSALASWTSARRCLEVGVQRLMASSDTATIPRNIFSLVLDKIGQSVRLQTLVLPWLALRMSLEHALCVSISLAQIAIASFFENWGTHGPPLCRIVAIIGHLLSSIALLFASRVWLLPSGSEQASPNTSSKRTSAFWLCVTFGHWVSISWAAATWWPAAATAAAKATIARANSHCVDGESIQKIPSSASIYIHLPLLASVVLHFANIWNASRARQPLLLFACVVLSEGSVIASCCIGNHLPDVAFSSSWRTTILPLFCLSSAWIIWQELVRSLADAT